jgi:molybdopterin-guanine dinucleotide biosynthesis protein A
MSPVRPATQRIVAIVLAGGEAKRMGGGDKPLLSVGGRPMLAAVIDALALPDTAISANGDPSRFAAFGLPVLSDGAFHGHGPLAGVLAGLDWAASLGAEVLLTVPGDTPFVPKGLAARLFPPPCCASSNDRVHYLVAAWPVDCADPLRRFLGSVGTRRVGAFAETIGMRRVEFSSNAVDFFVNVNTPEDLADARGFAGRGGEDAAPGR